MQATGTAALATTLLALGRWPSLTQESILVGIGLAVAGSFSLFLLYRGLALGPIAVVSPIVASYSALTVLLVVVFLGDPLTADQIAAIAIVFAGVLLSTADVRAIASTIRRPLPGVPISLLATVGFAVWGALFAAGTRQHDGMALILVGRASAIFMMAATILVVRSARPREFGPKSAVLVLTVGVFDTLANVAFMLGVQTGNAAIAITGSGLYPLLPAVMGIVRHGERLAPNQYLGILIVVGGLVALGLRA